ncbi:MAG: hypothetical protein Roseis2KO_13870 [Roseivirga sp.]
MEFFVYIIYSHKLRTFYKGQTQDLNDRLSRHNNGYEKATTSGRPWTLLWATQKGSRREALLLEKKLKNLSQKRLLEFMMKYRQDMVTGQESFIKGFEP